MFKAYIGFDPREEEAFFVAVRSLMEHTSMHIEPVPLMDWHLKALGVYYRTWHRSELGQKVDDLDGKPFSTDFAFTRFLIPHLMRYKGWALFCDCDFMFRADISELVALADPKYAVMVVKHDHKPHEVKKMDGCVQETYPRKNWSSLILWNCSHPKNQLLTPDVVNNRHGAWLHGFRWLADEDIGAIPEAWNWLEGYSSPKIYPKAVHYTRGGPWFKDYEDVEYAAEWFSYSA